MTQATAPTVGVNLLRPLSLPAVERELLTMQTLVKQKRYLPAEYQLLFTRIQDAWEFYRPSQPAGHQAHIDRLIAYVFEHA